MRGAGAAALTAKLWRTKKVQYMEAAQQTRMQAAFTHHSSEVRGLICSQDTITAFQMAASAALLTTQHGCWMAYLIPKEVLLHPPFEDCIELAFCCVILVPDQLAAVPVCLCQLTYVKLF